MPFLISYHRCSRLVCLSSAPKSSWFNLLLHGAPSIWLEPLQFLQSMDTKWIIFHLHTNVACKNLHFWLTVLFAVTNDSNWQIKVWNVHIFGVWASLFWSIYIISEYQYFWGVFNDVIVVMFFTKCQKIWYTCDKGKPDENRGRKATGLKSLIRLWQPVAVRGYSIIMSSVWQAPDGGYFYEN